MLLYVRFGVDSNPTLSASSSNPRKIGTVAAGEFLVNENRMEEILKQLPADWRKKNIEVVLETQVIQGRSGPPRVKAVDVW
jgi:hypothetical protein